MNSFDRRRLGAADTQAFRLDLPVAERPADVLYPPRRYRRSWTHDELLALFPDHAVRVLDVGAGDKPFRVRSHDGLTTVDFDPSSEADVLLDVARAWPFAAEEFDFVNMSHVVEHLYPRDRDALIRNVHHSLRHGGLLFIRVPHKSSVQATGWEHFTYYGLNGVTSLCHGRNPLLPMFRAVSAGVATSIEFDRTRPRGSALVERVLNTRWQLTDQLLGRLLGGIAEVQFLLQRMPASLEERLRPASGATV